MKVAVSAYKLGSSKNPLYENLSKIPEKIDQIFGEESVPKTYRL
jgi:hypothetical protein